MALSHQRKSHNQQASNLLTEQRYPEIFYLEIFYPKPPLKSRLGPKQPVPLFSIPIPKRPLATISEFFGVPPTDTHSDSTMECHFPKSPSPSPSKPLTPRTPPPATPRATPSAIGLKIRKFKIPLKSAKLRRHRQMLKFPRNNQSFLHRRTWTSYSGPL
jgi:hypothetical protein